MKGERTKPESLDSLVTAGDDLRRRLEEAEETVRAIRAGEVDAIVVDAEPGQVYTLDTADKPYRLLVEQMPQGAATLTVEGTILYCNRRFADLLKQPLPSLLGQLIHGLVSPDSRPLLEALLRDSQIGEVQGEVTLQRADGSVVPVYLGVNALREGALGLCLMVTDLTEQEARKKAERFADRIARLQGVTAALSEALTVDQVAEVIVTHGLAALGASVGVVAMLTEDGAEFVNLRVVGYPPEVAEGWTRFPADAPLPMADAVRTGQPIVVKTLAEQNARYPELVRLKASAGDGALVAFPLLVHGRALGALRLNCPTSRTFHAEDFDFMQTVAQQFGQALERARLHDSERRAREKAQQEIEERKRAEEALRESEARYRNLLFAVPAAVYTTDRQGRITLFNDQAAALWGRRPVIGKDLWCGSWRIFRPDGTPLPHGQCPMAVALHEGRSVHGQEIIVERPDGTRVWVLPYPEPLRDTSGEIVGAVNMLVDISDRKRTEEALRDAHDQLGRRVAERTAELAKVNDALKAEMEAHKQTEVAHRESMQQLINAKEAERHRIARELHDQMGQHLTALVLGLKVLRNATPESSPACERLLQLQELADLIGKEVHHLALELRPTALDDLGLHTTLVNYVEEWSERTQVEIDFHSTGLEVKRLPSPIETALYRMVQEGLTNVLKHAQARRVSLILQRSPHQVLAILEDDGRGFDTEAVINSSGPPRRLGLLGMKERVALVGGTLTIESTPGRGTTIFARIPLPADEVEDSDG